MYDCSYEVVFRSFQNLLKTRSFWLCPDMQGFRVQQEYTFFFLWLQPVVNICNLKLYLVCLICSKTDFLNSRRSLTCVMWQGTLNTHFFCILGLIMGGLSGQDTSLITNNLLNYLNFEKSERIRINEKDWQVGYGVGATKVKTKSIVTVCQTFSHVREPLHKQPEIQNNNVNYPQMLNDVCNIKKLTFSV